MLGTRANHWLSAASPWDNLQSYVAGPQTPPLNNTTLLGLAKDQLRCFQPARAGGGGRVGQRLEVGNFQGEAFLVTTGKGHVVPPLFLSRDRFHVTPSTSSCSPEPQLSDEGLLLEIG